MIGYVARDKDGEIYLHMKKPTYNSDFVGWFSDSDMFCITKEFPEFNNMSYTDKPIKVEVKLEKV